MNQFSKLALALALTLVGVTGANAQQIAGSDTRITQLNTYNGDTQWTFSDATLQQYDADAGTFTGPALDRAAGDAFIDVFIVNIPDNEYVSFSFGNDRGALPGAEFSQLAVGYAYGTGPEVFDALYGNKTYSVTTDQLTLLTGTYEFDIYGSFTKTGGGFAGDVFGSPIPEPGNWALMFAGLGAMAVLARRRRNAQS